MFAVKTGLSEIKIVNALSGQSGAALPNKCHFGSKDINKKYMARQSPDNCFDSTRFCSLVKLSIFTCLIIHGITHLFSTSTWWCRRLPVYCSTYLPLDWLNVFLGLENTHEQNSNPAYALIIKVYSGPTLCASSFHRGTFLQGDLDTLHASLDLLVVNMQLYLKYEFLNKMQITF